MPFPLLILVMLALSISACGEQLSGHAASSSGVALKGVRVTVQHATSGTPIASARSESSGDWAVSVPPGVYQLVAEATGFNPWRLADAHTGQDIIIVLNPATPDDNAVRYQPVVDAERTHPADFIADRQLQNLPVNRRDYLTLAALTPGVSLVNDYVGISDAPLAQAPQSGLSFGGNNGRGNVFWLDGGENYLNTGGVRPSIGQDAVQEFQVWRSNYSAEFGGGIGGIVNIISKSGTNQIHGDLFGYLRQRALQARNFFDNGGTSYTRSQTGATLGMPIRKDRTFAFFSWERLQSRESAEVAIGRVDRGPFYRLRKGQDDIADVLIASGDPNSIVLGALARQLLLTTNFPSTLALFASNRGVLPFGESLNQGSLRVDHRFSDNHNAFLRINFATGGQQNSQLEGITGYSRGIVSDLSDQTFMLNDTFVISSNLVSESRFLLSRTRFNARNRDAIGPSIDIDGYGLFNKDWTLPTDFGEWHGQLQQNFFYASGRHSIRFGADINPVRAAAILQTNFGGRFTFGEYLPLSAFFNGLTSNPGTSDAIAAALRLAGRKDLVKDLKVPLTAIQAFNLGVPAVYIQGFGDPSWMGWFQRYNFFINDVIRLNPRLTVNAGLRYELESAPSGLGTHNDLAPRLGLAWDVSGDRKTVVRAGYGLFFLRQQSQISAAVDTQSGSSYNQIVVPLTGLPGIINKATGQPVNSSDIYRALSAQGIIGKRAIVASDLKQFGIVPGPNDPFQILFLKPKDFQNAWAHQASFEIERAFGATSLLLGYNFNRGAHLPRLRDTNVQYGPVDSLGNTTQIPLDPYAGQRLVYESAANSFYHALFIQSTRRFSKNLTFNGHYTFSKSIDESTDIQFLPQNSLNTRADRGLSTFDQRHRLVVSSVLDLPGKAKWIRGFTFAPIISASSGRPFNVVTGIDFNTYRPAGAGRNIGQGPSFYTADARLSRTFVLSKSHESLRLEFLVEAFNLTNHTNFKRLNNTVGNITVNDLPHPLIGQLGQPEDPLSFVSAFNARQLQFGLKLRW